MIKVGLLCTSPTPSLRPDMSEVVSMLEGKTSIPEITPEASTSGEDLRFKAIREFQQAKQRSQQNTGHNPTPVTRQESSSTSGQDLYEIQEESYSKSTTMRDQTESTEGWSSKTGQEPSYHQ